MPKYSQGFFAPRNPEKYEGNPHQICYRSSWEKRLFAWCDSNPAVVKWHSEETVIPYRCPTDNRLHRYFVDVKIQVKDSETGLLKTFLIEVKPAAQTKPPRKNARRYIEESLTFVKNQSKWKAAREYCADRGWSFVILTEKDLGIKG